MTQNRLFWTNHYSPPGWELPMDDLETLVQSPTLLPKIGILMDDLETLVQGILPGVSCGTFCPGLACGDYHPRILSAFTLHCRHLAPMLPSVKNPKTFVISPQFQSLKSFSHYISAGCERSVGEDNKSSDCIFRRLICSFKVRCTEQEEN